MTRSEHEALIRAQLAEAAQALQLCSTGLRGMCIVGNEQAQERVRWIGDIGYGVRNLDKQSLEPITPAIWPDHALDGDELWYATWSGLLPGAKTRIRATNAQITALDKILPMFYQIKDQRHRAAVYLRAAWTRLDKDGKPRSAGWRRIGAALGCSHMTARAWERMGIEEIVKCARRNAY
jgi:hypothetical protein